MNANMMRVANGILALLLLAGGVFYLIAGNGPNVSAIQQTAGGALATAFFVLMLALALDYRLRENNRLLEQQNELLLLLVRRGKKQRPTEVNIERDFSLDDLDMP